MAGQAGLEPATTGFGVRRSSQLELLINFCDNTRAHSPTAFTNREVETLIHRHGRDQFDFYVDIISGHDHLGPFWQLHNARNIRSTEIELGTITIEERRVTPTFLLGENIRLRIEFRVRCYASRFRQYLSSLHFFTFCAAQKYTDIVTRLPFVQELTEHLHTGRDGFLSLPEADDLDFLSNFDNAALNPASNHCSATADGKYILDRHNEWLIDIPNRLLHKTIYGVHE